MKPDAFKNFHPLVNFIYFALVLGFTMVLNHPAALFLSLMCAFLYAVWCEGRKAVLFTVKFGLPVLLLTAFINPAFNHQGTVFLCYLPSGNPLTLESILYGLFSGIRFAAVLLWFLNLNRVITSDKLIYLLGRIAPALSLVLSMTLCFVPRFKAQYEAVCEAQKGAGRAAANTGLWRKIKNAAAVLSIMIIWSLENAIETADSMKSRGYGLKGRTAFSVYRLEQRDKSALCLLLFCGFFLLSGNLAGGLSFRYFPNIRSIPANAFTFSFLAAYFILCTLPIILNAKEAKKWTALRSKI